MGRKTKEESKALIKVRKNPYIAITFALGLMCIFMIIGDIIESRSINKTENEILCSVISSVPAWADSNGKIIRYGLLIPQNESS